MNVFIQFINRQKELEFLQSQIEKPASLVVIYGRRRVGKTELIRHFIRGKKAIYLLATQEVEKEVVESFSKEIAEYFNDSALKANPFTKFKQVAEYFKEKNNLLLVIDEFPYLIDSNGAVPSIVQKYWDGHFKSKNFHIVLCGSSIGTMETEVLGRKSPLYGRRTGQWKVDPLLFKEFACFFPKTSFEKLVQFYSITGGIPLYILEFDGVKSVFENARSAIAKRGSILYQEAEIILKEELREPKTYFSILKEIANGKNTLNEISNAIGAERTALVRYINTLMELDLIEATRPVTAKEKSRNTFYVLKDNYFKFWFKFIYPFKIDLDSFSFDSFQKNFGQNFNSFVGKQFEQICKEAIMAKNPVAPAKVGGWWGYYRENNERKAIEIDVVSINEEKKEILFGECKWREKIAPKGILKSLKKKAAFVQWNNESRKEHFVIFAKSFKEKKVGEQNVALFDLKDLERWARTGFL